MEAIFEGLSNKQASDHIRAHLRRCVSREKGRFFSLPVQISLLDQLLDYIDELEAVIQKQKGE